MKQIEFYAKHQKKGLMISKTMRPFIYIPQFGIVQATNPSCLLYFP